MKIVCTSCANLLHIHAQNDMIVCDKCKSKYPRAVDQEWRVSTFDTNREVSAWIRVIEYVFPFWFMDAVNIVKAIVESGQFETYAILVNLVRKGGYVAETAYEDDLTYIVTLRRVQ